MEKIYLKNYKGFTDQILNLCDVNFLVGENSTGKTSLLKIIGLLSSREFWFDSEFTNSDLELGYFEEILNKSSSDNHFRIATEKLIEEEGQQILARVLFEWKEENSLPKIHRVKLNHSGYDLLITLTNKQIRYKFKKEAKRSFENWVSDFRFSSKHRVLKIAFNMPIFLTLTFVEEHFRKFVDIDKNSAHTPTNRALYSQYKWLAPVRAKPRRIYESYKSKYSPEGNHIPTLLKNLLHKTRSKSRFSSN